MKQFRKNQEAHFICEECGRVCKDKTALVNHNRNTHKISRDEYFDKWIKEEGDDICVICGNKTKLIRTDRGYKTTCSIKCQNIYAANQTKKANIEKYGVENPYQRPDIIEKCKKIKKDRYGDEKYQNREQIEQTNLKRYGSKYPFGNPDILEKTFKNCISSSIFRNTKIYFQGSYELDFLEKYYDKFPEIVRGPRISYIFQHNKKIYHSDFYIPSLNLVVEIKNSYLFKRDTTIILTKEKATIANGFNYIMILDKDYNKFNQLINHSSIHI